MTQVSSLGRKQEQHSRWSAKGIGRNGTFQSELREIFHAWLSWVDGVVAVGEADERSNKARGNSTFETQGYEWGSHDYLGFVGRPSSVDRGGWQSGGGGARVGAVLLWRLGSDRDVVQIWSGSEMAYQQAATFAIFIDVDGRNNDNGRGKWSGRREECCGVGTDAAAAVLNDGNWRRTNRCVGGGQHFKTFLVNVSVHEGSPPPPPSPRRGIRACCISE